MEFFIPVLQTKLAEAGTQDLAEFLRALQASPASPRFAFKAHPAEAG